MEKKFRKTIITQIAILTPDIEKSKAAWEKFLGIEERPITESYGYEITRATYHGEPLHGRIRQVCFAFDNVEMELIQPIGEEPSYWKECLDKNGPGVHHISFAVKNLEECISECEALGMPLQQQGRWPREEWPGGRYAYVDGTDSLHVVLELLEKEEEVL